MATYSNTDPGYEAKKAQGLENFLDVEAVEEAVDDAACDCARNEDGDRDRKPLDLLARHRVSGSVAKRESDRCCKQEGAVQVERCERIQHPGQVGVGKRAD